MVVHDVSVPRFPSYSGLTCARLVPESAARARRTDVKMGYGQAGGSASGWHLTAMMCGGGISALPRRSTGERELERGLGGAADGFELAAELRGEGGLVLEKLVNARQQRGGGVLLAGVEEGAD